MVKFSFNVTLECLLFFCFAPTVASRRETYAFLYVQRDFHSPYSRMLMVSCAFFPPLTAESSGKIGARGSGMKKNGNEYRGGVVVVPVPSGAVTRLLGIVTRCTAAGR